MSSSTAVIGAGGFLGRSLVAELARRGVPVAEFTRSVPFLTNGGALAPGVATAGTAYWLATTINPQIAEQQPEEVVADRALFAGFLTAVRRLRVPPTVVLLSSGGTVYDPETPPPYAEDAPTRPRSAYGRAKLELEGMLADTGLGAGRALALRVSNAYGPGQPVASGQGVVAHWLAAARRGEDIRLYGDPSTTRDYVYVADVAAALADVHGCANPLPAVLNAGSGIPTSLQRLAEIVLEVVDIPRLALDVAPSRSFDVPRTWLDVRRAQEVLGWRAATPLPVGVAATWAAMRAATAVGG